ncbi:hypothetical protein [Pantoea brenneri]|uniref:hypothetical protein n=1 Tax=Pantoea brenneri TaxID=472694 RepID=UPI0028A128FB|nr:hypothetical protein [Pantoea brenneri]
MNKIATGASSVGVSPRRFTAQTCTGFRKKSPDRTAFSGDIVSADLMDKEPETQT